MDHTDDAAVTAVDKKRQELEANVNKLRNALQHWQKWEIDYGEFQEKLDDASDEPDFETLKGIRDSIDATLITDEEVTELLGTDRGVKRDRDQINALLSRRVDYVRQNAQSLQKQLDLAEAELRKLYDSDADAFRDEQGLPITEILEELDEDGNVVSGKTSTTSDAAAGAAGLLKKAGVKDWVDPIPEVLASNNTSLYDAEPTNAPSDSKSAASTTSTKATKRKKSVAFASEVDIAPAPARRGSSPPPLRSMSPPPTELPPTPIRSRPSVPWEVDEARKGRFHTGTRVIELNDDDEEVGSLPVVPPADFEESEEDARLRREMQQYALNEVGAIVAEMDLEDGSDYEEDDDEAGDHHFADSEDEDENEYGMTAFDRISDKDRKQMLELERKLQAKMMQNVGPLSGLDGKELDANDVRRLIVKTDDPSTVENVGRRSSKVHFADEAEVLPTPIDPASAVSDKPAFEETVFERSDASTSAIEDARPKKKQSRFKSTMSGRQGMPSIPIHMRDNNDKSAQGPAEPPTGPEGQVLSTSVLERPSQAKTVLPPDESGIDPALLQQELAVENRRLFNKMVQQQGGFHPSPEDEDNPLMEEKDGKVRKVSRFKAARINAGGIQH